MELKTDTRSWLKHRAPTAVVAAAASAALVGALIAPGASSAKVTAHHAAAHAAGGTPLTCESAPEPAFTPPNYNPFVQSTAAYQAGADSLMYEPLMDFNLDNP